MHGRSVFLIVLLAAGCGGTPTSPSTAVTSSSQYFVAAVPPGETAMYTFSVSSQSYIGVTLAAVNSLVTREPTGANVLLALGTPAGDACVAIASLDVAAALSAQITQRLNAGSYCISVANNGGLPEEAEIAARITATSAEPTASTANTTDSFSSMLTRGGTAERTIRTSAGGIVTLTLTTAAADKSLRLSLGLWDGAVCRVTASTDTPLGSAPQVVAGVDAGDYCVRVRDIDQSGFMNFVVSIAHP